jgi:hypothetical protein
MEKWSRPIFSKLVDERGGKNFLSTAEVSEHETTHLPHTTLCNHFRISDDCIP